MIPQILLNDEVIDVVQPLNVTLLDLIRYHKGLRGTKIGCREGDCGACAVLVGRLKGSGVSYKSVVSCLTPVANVIGAHVITIEGLSPSVIQDKFAHLNATQCGFCTPGFIVSFAASLINGEGILQNLDGNICRCTGYYSIIRAAGEIEQEANSNDLKSLVDLGYLPGSILEAPSILEALSPLAKNDGAELVVGGGTDLYVQSHYQILKVVNAEYRSTIDHRISQDDHRIIVDSGITMEEFITSEIIREWINIPRTKLIASRLIRNTATLAGNIVNASPIGDFSIILLALNASIELDSRPVALDRLFLGYKQLDMQDGELVQRILLPKVNGIRINFEKVSKRKLLDIASVNSAMAVVEDDGVLTNVRISAGGVAPIPLYLRRTSEFMQGKQIERNVLEEALMIMDKEISPISDVRGSSEYKRLLLKRLFLSHMLELFPELEEELPL